MPAQEVTLAQIFAGPDNRFPEAAGTGGTAVRFQQVKERIAEEVKGIEWPAAMPDLARKVGELFDIPVPDIMISAWKKADEIEKALEESQTAPADTTHISLSEHTISAELHPEIEVKVKHIPVKTLKFLLRLSFTVEGAVLGIQNGRIFEIAMGSCKAKGTVEYEDIVIARKEFTPVRFPRILQIDEASRSDAGAA